MSLDSTQERNREPPAGGLDFVQELNDFVLAYNGVDVPSVDQYEQARALGSRIQKRQEDEITQFYGPEGEHIPEPYVNLLRAGGSGKWRPDAAGRARLRKVLQHRPSDEVDPEVLDEFLSRYSNFQNEADLSAKFTAFQREAVQRLALANALETREQRRSETLTSRHARLVRALGTLAAGGGRLRRAVSSRHTTTATESPVDVVDQQHRRRKQERQGSPTKHEKRTRRTVAAVTVTALGVSAVFIVLGLKESGEKEGGPTPAPVPSRTAKPTPSPTVAPSPTISPSPSKAQSGKAPATGQSPPGHPGHLHHPQASDVRVGERPWDTLWRLGVPADEIMPDLRRAAQQAGAPYEWHGHGKHRWIEVNGHSGTRHVMSALGSYIILPS